MSRPPVRPVLVSAILFAAIAGKNLYLSVSRSFIQDAVWD